MSEELRPCPFCGVNEWQYHTHFSGASVFQCEKCGTIVDECVLNTRPIEDALQARIADCESALISMVQQFFYSKDGENIFRHAFMSAEEEAADYLVEHGIARWADKRKSSIYFNEVQE